MSSTPPGLFASLRGFGATAVALLRTRLELLKLETHEEVNRISGLLLWGVAAAVLGGASMVFLAIFFTILFWDSHRLLVLGIISALFLGATIIAAGVAARLARQDSQLFSASLAELRRDEAALDRDRHQA